MQAHEERSFDMPSVEDKLSELPEDVADTIIYSEGNDTLQNISYMEEEMVSEEEIGEDVNDDDDDNCDDEDTEGED